MGLFNANVTVTIPQPGILTSSGSYEYKEKTTSGSILPVEQRLFIFKKPTYSNCFRKTELSEAFVNHAISDHGRPAISDGYKAHTFWKKMTQLERLHFHIAKYASDFGSSNYSFKIHEL